MSSISKQKAAIVCVASGVLWLELFIWIATHYSTHIQPLPDFWEASIVIWVVITAFLLVIISTGVDFKK